MQIEKESITQFSATEECLTKYIKKKQKSDYEIFVFKSLYIILIPFNIYMKKNLNIWR